MADTLTFETQAAATEFFGLLGYRAIPIRGQHVYVAEGFDDLGRPIMTFARRHVADALSFTLTEVVRR